MPNPIFIIVALFILWSASKSLYNYFWGLKALFAYLAVAGFLKRAMFIFGIPSGFEYTVFVGFPLILFVSLLFGSFSQRNYAKERKTNDNRIGKFKLLYIVFVLLLFVGLFRNPLPLQVSLVPFLTSVFWLLSFPIGLKLKEKQISELIHFFVWSSIPIALHGIFQFFYGPFGFELDSVKTVSSVSEWGTGTFFRTIPLYDSFESEAIHMVIAFLFARTSSKNLSVPTAFFVRLLVIVTLIVSGNRGGFVLLFIAILFLFIYKYKHLTIRLRSFILTATFMVLIFLLTIFYIPFSETISAVANLSSGGTDFAMRLGTLNTFFDRLVGRQNAINNLSLFGVGTGYQNAHLVLNKQGFENVNIDFIKESGVWAHDLLGETMIEQGIIGAIILGAMFWLFIQLTSKSATAIGQHRNFLYGLSAIFLSAAATGSILGGSYFWGRHSVFLWIAAGFCISQNGVKKFMGLLPTEWVIFNIKR